VCEWISTPELLLRFHRYECNCDRKTLLNSVVENKHYSNVYFRAQFEKYFNRKYTGPHDFNAVCR